MALRHRCSPVDLLYIFRIPFAKTTSGWLLLDLLTFSENIDNLNRTGNHKPHALEK